MQRGAAGRGGTNSERGRSKKFHRYLVQTCVDRVHTLYWSTMGAKRPRVKTADVNIRITPKLKEAARKAAQLDQRTLSSLIERLLTEHCQKVGTLKRRP
jgi:hypothetical protein